MIWCKDKDGSWNHENIDLDNREDINPDFDHISCLNETAIMNTNLPESGFNVQSVAMGMMKASACLVFVFVLTGRIKAKILGGKDEGQEMVGMIKKGNN